MICKIEEQLNKKLNEARENIKSNTDDRKIAYWMGAYSAYRFAIKQLKQWKKN